MHEAAFWETAGNASTRCLLCPHRCLIGEGKSGICGVRRNDGGTLVSLVDGRLISAAVDPMEKKPLFHFLPGSTVFSVAAVGCNMRCRHCQNADISQMPSDKHRVAGRPVTAEEIVASAVESGCASIACTYTEPTVWYEYARRIATLARGKSLRTVFVTNGFIEETPLRAVAPILDAANIDLKGFTDEFYRSVCGARLQPVLDTIRRCRELGIWIEVTTLVIPGLNDSEEELRGIARFIASVGREVPWHLSRFHPDYRMTDREATPLATLRMAGEIGRSEGLHHVYLGNVPDEGEATRCHACGTSVIRRRGYMVIENLVAGGRCPSCAAVQHGVFA